MPDQTLWFVANNSSPLRVWKSMDQGKSWMEPPDELQTIVERRDYLAARIQAKKSMSPPWETQYDEREHRALCWALGKLAPLEDDGA